MASGFGFRGERSQSSFAVGVDACCARGASMSPGSRRPTHSFGRAIAPIPSAVGCSHAFPSDPPARTAMQAPNPFELRTTDARGPSDRQLMDAIMADDETALGRLIDRHWNSLVWFASGRLASSDEAEDVAQEVFVRLWEHRKRWQSKDSVKAFLYRITRNLVISRIRHRQVRGRVEPELLGRMVRTVTPIDAVVHRELKDAFEKELSALPERRREAFLLVRTLGLSLSEAAEVMEVSRRTVANHLYLATMDLQARLRRFLKP
ncbi:MAG: sigma-70 family RNA polymerase sigma factor [Gemmatimonas sp.]|nr:sigma-70 family RNA polymerase sigma factor [Gemmatimonas sp.]